MQEFNKIIEIGTKIKTYNDYHSIDEVIKDIDDLFILLKDAQKKYEQLQNKYQTVLELSKENADAAEFCIRNLETQLDKIEQICRTAPDVDTEMSLRILEVLGVLESEVNE